MIASNSFKYFFRVSHNCQINKDHLRKKHICRRTVDFYSLQKVRAEWIPIRKTWVHVERSFWYQHAERSIGMILRRIAENLEKTARGALRNLLVKCMVWYCLKHSLIISQITTVKPPQAFLIFYDVFSKPGAIFEYRDSKYGKSWKRRFKKEKKDLIEKK